jgi:hypothetical protein
MICYNGALLIGKRNYEVSFVGDGGYSMKEFSVLIPKFDPSQGISLSLVDPSRFN